MSEDPAPSSILSVEQLHGGVGAGAGPGGNSDSPNPPGGTPISEGSRKPKTPSVRRACTACHTGKTRCSEVLPCQSCLKRGLGTSCAYPDPEASDTTSHHPPTTTAATTYGPPPIFGSVQPTNLSQQHYYDFSGTYTGASSSTFRPNKRARPLTEEETAAITRASGFTRGDFYVGTSAPVRIDPRLPVRLTLGEGDQVHFTVGEALV